MLNCAKALSELHSELHFIHLDIKPENIMITSETGDIGLIDLGEGCFDDELERCTLHRYKSTIGYISPEIMFDWEYIESNPKILRASDIYSLGCVFYELLYSRKVYGWIEDSYDTNQQNFIETLAYILDRINFEELYEVNKIRDAQQLRQYVNKYDIKTKERSIEVHSDEYENYSQFRKLDEIINRMLDPDCETRITLNEVIETLQSEGSDPPLSVYSSDSDSSVYLDLPFMQSGGDGDDLFKEIKNKNISKIRNLISLNPLRLYDFYKESDYKFTPIEWAVKNNCLECIDAILKSYELYKTDTIIRFNTDVRFLGQPIHFAVENGNLDMISYLVSRDFNVNKLNKMGLAPLHLAIKKNKINIVLFLLRQLGIDKMKLDGDGLTPLELALQMHHLQIATAIIRSGVKPNMELLNRRFKEDALVRDFLKEISVKLSRRKKTQAQRQDRLDRILFYDYLCSNLNEAINPQIIAGLSKELNTDINKLTKKELCETLLKSIFFEKTLSEEY
jgi:serine/threonine protein kinase